MGAEILVAARFLQFAGALVLFGAPLFFLYGFDNGSPLTMAARVRWQYTMVRIAASIALLGALAWVIAETAAVSDSEVNAVNPATLWLILSETRFGLAALTRIVLLTASIVASLCLYRPRVFWMAEALLGAAAVGSFAWTGHGAITNGPAAIGHLAADLLHLLTAGLWMGALLSIVVLVLRSVDSQTAQDARAVQFGLERFSAIGIFVVGVLVLSGLINSWFLIGPSRWRELFTSVYGVLLLAKVALFSGMLGLAAFNRYRAAPILQADLEQHRSIRPSLRVLSASVLTETGLALLVLILVSILGSVAPPISG